MGNSIGFIFLALALVGLSFILRMRRNPVKDQLEIVQGLASEARLDIRMADVLKTHPNPRPFVTTTWLLRRKHVDFVDAALRDSLEKAFELAEEYNVTIYAARKTKSFGALSSLDTEKLKGLLAVCQESLEQWMLLKVGSRNPPEKGPIVLDFLIGKH